MPLVTLRTTVNDQEETMSQYMCDWPDCPQPGLHLLGVIAELRLRAVVCAEHLAQFQSRTKRDNQR